MFPSAILFAAISLFAAGPYHEGDLIFPLHPRHNHASAIVELSNGDLLVCWYRGSGERTADDVAVMGARLRKGSKQWSQPFVLADTPAFPDTNPMLFVDSRKRLWLFWQVIIANEWHTALTRYMVSTDYAGAGPPKWQVSEPLLVIPRNFEQKVREAVGRRVGNEPSDSAIARWGKRTIEHAADKYFSRMGWMTRAHALELPSGRILLPLYSDGYSFSLIGITDDGGRTWTTSEPLVGGGNIQPSIARRKDGTLIAYMRDNGPPPKQLHISESKDDGLTWTPVIDSGIPNPGSGSEVIVLKDGTWALVNNDLEKGRYSLALWLSEDEGRTWKWKRALERDEKNEPRGSFHYPSIIQSRDGLLHISYTYSMNHLPKGEPREAIKHAVVNLEWAKSAEK
ncbi:MAG: sialidase family protein [Bryobacteraceae bacterium]|nr:sialidase family protein [Bryobacteraceae bacterium]